ncbi:hypothetical protein WA026_020216 [Henosepilachna vigintioctopunctata]|uniref:Uncharacterized protein n=1 Tax=Henosepilachna vigintioctopunctata TaxID=420089 RepID=A0AAW1UBK2_9CUCU
MHSERRRKQLLRATHSMEYTSHISASIADIIRRVVFASSQTSRSVAEFRRTLYMLHDYNTLVFKCTYHYPISTETKRLLRRYVELESYILYKSKWTPEIEDQVQNRVFKTVMYFISGSYHATGQSIAEDRKLIFDEALKIFIHFADVSIDRFPAKILRNILNTLGIVNTSTNSDSALYVNHPSLKRLKEYLRDSDYGSDDDSVGSSEEAGIRQSSFKIHNEKKLLEKPPRVKFELNASNRVASSSSHVSLSMPINNSSFIRDRTSVVNLLSKSGNELSSVNNLGVQSISHNQQVSSQIRSRFNSGERSGFPEICTMFQSSDFPCSEEKCDFDSKPIMDKANDDFECIPTDFAHILDKRKRNTSIDEFPYTSSKHQSNMIQLAQYRDDAITKVNELEPIVNLTAIPEFSIGIPEQKTTVADESNIENITLSSAINMQSEFSSDAIFSSGLIVDASAIQAPLHLKTVSAENGDNGSVTDNFNPISLNQNNDSETIVTNVTVPSDDTYTRLSRPEMFSGCSVGAIQYTEILDENISTKITAPVHSSENESQVEEFDYSNKHTDQSHSDINNSYRNIINVAHKPVKASRIQEILSLKEKSEQYKLESSETFSLKTHNSISLIVLSQNTITEKIVSDETQKLPNGDFNKLDTPLINLIDNEGNSCATSKNSYENIASTSKVKAGNTFNPIFEDAIVDETTATTITTQLYPESHQAQKNNANVNMSVMGDSSTTATTITTQLYPESHQAQKNNANVNMSLMGDSSTITRLENTHDFTLEPQLGFDKKEISIQEDINKNKNNFSAALEHTLKTICEAESRILEVGKLDEKSSKYASLSENKRTTCDVHEIRINQNVQSVLEGTVISDKILDNESFTCNLTSAHGTCHIASDGKMAKIPKMKSQPDTENINSSPIVNKINNFHPIKLNNYTGDTELVLKEKEEYSNRNNTIINVHKQLKSNSEIEKELVDDNSRCGIIGQNETNSILDQPLVSNNTNDVSSTREIILEDKFGKVHKASIDDKTSTKIIHDLDTYKTQQYNRTFNLNCNGEPSSVVSLDNLQQNIVNDFVIDTEFISTEEQRPSEESGSKHQLPLRDEEFNFTFQRDVNGITPKISKCIIDDSGNTSIVNKEFPNVTQREIIEVINNFSAPFESNDDVNMQNKSEEQKTKSSCLPESNIYTSAENSSHSIPGLSGDILLINEGETINSISDQSLDSINTRDKRSLSSEEKSEDAFDDVNTLPISDNSCSPNILQHDSESDQTAFDLNVNTNTIITPIVTSEASNQHVNNDFDVETRLDFDKHEVDPTQGNNSENQLLVSSKKLTKNSIDIENSINFRSSGQKENYSSGSGFLEARNKIDDDLSVEIENLSAFTHETKVPLLDANKGDNISVQHADQYHQNIEHHTSVGEKNPSSITENERTFQNVDEMLTRESGVNEIEELISSSEDALKIDLDKADSDISLITKCVDIDTNITVNVDSTFESETPSLLINHNLSLKKEEKILLDYAMQDRNAIETMFCENISDGVNELRSIAKFKSISELPTPLQKSKATITHVTALNEGSVLTSNVNEIEEVIDSSSQEAVKFDLEKPDSRIITEVVEVDSNITINSDNLFETETMDNDSTSKKEDETVVDCVMQDPNAMETTFCENISDGVNELSSIAKLKSISKLPTPIQESKATIANVTAPNEKSVLTSNVNEIEEVIDSSSQEAVKFNLEKTYSRIITEVVEVNSNITINSDSLFETETMDNDSTSKKEDKTVVDCVMQDPNAMETTFCENISDGVNELRSIAKLKSLSELPTPIQESKATIAHVTAPNEESVLTSNVNEIEKVIDSSSQEAVKFDLEKPVSRIITEVVEVDSNITINSDSLFESESMDNESTSKKEDKTMVDYLIQDPRMIEATFCHNVSSRMNELRSLKELKPISEFATSQESETVITYVSCLNGKSDLITSGNKIENVVDSSSKKAVKFGLDMPDLGIKEITECVDIDINVVHSLFETELPSQSIHDHDSSTKKEDEKVVDCVMQDPNIIENTFCKNVPDGLNEPISFAKSKSVSKFPIPSQESETAKTSVSCLNKESDFITSIYEAEEVIDSSSQKDINTGSAGIKQISECVDINTNTINADSTFVTDLPSESVDHDTPSRSFAELKSMSELPTASQASETVETYVSCLDEESNVNTSGNGIEKVIDSSSQKALKFDLDMPDLGIIEITECIDIDANVDRSSLETKLPSESNDHDSSLKKEYKTIVDYVTKDPHVTETIFYDDVSDGMNEVRSIVELKSKSKFQIPPQESETAKTSVSCLNKKTDVITSINEIKEVLDSSSQKEVNMDLDKPNWSENKITECLVIETNVVTNVNSAFDNTSPSELIDPNSSSKKEDEITVDYVMQDSIIIESTVCENISDEMNGLRSVAEIESISKFPFPTQELETVITSVSCLNQESDVITSVNDIEEVVDSSSEKDLKIDLDKLDLGMKEITVDYEDPNVIETSFCEKVSDRVNDLKLIAELKSVSEFPNSTHELEIPITAVTCLNQESTLLTDTGNTFSDDISSYNSLTIEKKHQNKQTSDILPMLPKEVNIEDSMLLTCETTSEDSFEKINPGIHKSPPDLNLNVINHTDSNEITEFQPLQNTLCNNISFEVHTDLMKETDILIEGKVNQQISEIMPKGILGNSTGSEISETVSTQKLKSRHGKKISSQSITDFTAYSIQKKTNVAENNSDNIITKPNTTESNKSPELNRNVPTEKVTLPIYREVVDFLPTDDKNKMITETSSHYKKVIAESSHVDVNGAPNVSANQEPNAKTLDTYYAFQVKSLPDELKMLADVASNRKHMKVAKGKPKTKVIIRNRSQKSCERKTESCNNKKTISKPQNAKNSKKNTTDIKTDRNKIINGKMSSHITNKKEKYLSLDVGKTCIEKPQKPNNSTSQSGPVSIRRRIKTLGELKHFDFSSFEKSNPNKLTDQPRYSENELKIIQTIDTMKDLSCETEFSLDKQKLLANSIGDSETTKDVPINVLDDTLEKKNLSSEVKADKHSTVFSEEEEKNKHQTEYLKHNELLDDRKINKKIARSDNGKSLQNNPQESVKVIVEEVFPMEYSGNIAKAIRTQTNPFELSSFYTEFVPCRLGVYTSPTRTADVPSTTNNVNSTKEDNFQKKTDIFVDKNSEYKCEESPPGDLKNQRFDSYDQTFSGNNSKVTNISNFEVAFTSTPIKDITESCKNKSGCGEKRKCTFDDISLSFENNEKKLLENTPRKNKRKHSPKKILLDNELNQKAKEINTFSTDGEKLDKPCSVEKPPYVVDDTISKPKEIRKSIEHIVTSLKSCNSRDISGSSSNVKLQEELVDYNSVINEKLSQGNVGNEGISILSNDEYNKIMSHLPFNQNNQKQSNKCETTNHMLEAETKETENYKISSDETCSNLCESVEISSIEKKEISSDETCSNLREGVEAENAPCKHVYFPNLLLSNDNTVTEKQISMQNQNMDCINEIEKPINLGVYSHLSEEQQFVDKISCDMLETQYAQKTGCTENSSNCMETLVETVASISGQNSNNVHIKDEFEPKLPADDLCFLIDEANNDFERTNFVFSSASEVSRLLADTNTSQISETFEQNSVMIPEEFDIRMVNSSFLETFVNGFPFCHDYGCIGSEVTVSSNILTDPLVGGQEEPISNKEESTMDDTDGSANNLLQEAPSFNDYMFMYGHDPAQAISQLNSQKLLTEFQTDNKLPPTNSQQSSFEDEKNDLKHSQINSQKALTADNNAENNDKLFQTNSPNCSTDNEKIAETACLPVHKISKNKLTENENSKKFQKITNVSKVTSVNLRNDICLRSRKDSVISKSSDSSVSFQSNNDSNEYERNKNKRKLSDSSLLTKDSILNESSISNTKPSVRKRKPSSETYNIQSKQIQDTVDSKINTLNIQVDNIERSSRLNRLRSASHTAAKVRETQKTQYDSMYDKVKSNQNRRAASKNINYSESHNDDHSSNKARKCKRIKTSTTSHDYTLHENYSEESCSSQNLEFEPLKSHNSSESNKVNNKSESRSETRHSKLVFDSRDFSSIEYSTCQRPKRATFERSGQRSQRTSKSDNYQTSSQLLSSSHRLSRSRSDIRTDQYKEKHKDSLISQNEKKVRFNGERSCKWRQSSSDRMSLEENKKRELFPKIPFRVGKQGTFSESDYEKDHKWREKFSELYPCTTTANMFSKQTPYGT